MDGINWAEELGVAITVSDSSGKIVYMNGKSASTFANEGGKSLLESSLRECHKPESWQKILQILDTGRANCYTIEKNGIKKMIFQAPWYENGITAGLVELSMEIPFVMEHFIRS
ncbi:MAG TPA: diguanylate cyclase [Bacteroidales bacterium]|nr:diguanylate cyclase [Bacteroidales bacterium]